MTKKMFTSDVIAAFPDAAISIDDGESVRFRANGLICAGRRLATGKWSVEVRDTRNASYEEADDIGEDNLKLREDVVPTLRRLADRFLFSSS